MIILFIFLSVYSYTPVILLHGFYMGSKDMDLMKGVIEKEHPGTDVVSISYYDYALSACTLYDQVNYVMDQVIQTRVERGWNNGFHLIGFSQGGIVARVVLGMLPYHQCRTFISLAGIQLGYFLSMPSWMKGFLPPFLEQMDYHDVWKYFYTANGQYNTTWGSLANAWNDPFHREEMKDGNLFLMNSLNAGHVPSIPYKQNFLNVQMMHYFASKDDGIVRPWNSPIFSSFKDNTEDETISMFDQWFYKTNDTIGLKMLYDNGRLHLHEVDGVPHMNWVQNQTIIETYVLPLLT